MKIIWLPAARRDQSGQVRYLSERNPRAALHFGDAIERAITPLLSYPAAGRQGRLSGTRELIVTGTLFLLIYQIREGQIVILRLLHGAQAWPEEPS